MSAFWIEDLMDMVKRNIFATAPGLVILVILLAGLLKGFNGAHICGVLGLFLLHHKGELIAAYERLTKSDAPVAMPPELERLKNDYEIFKANHQLVVDALKTEISKANIAIAFKTGARAPEQKS